MSSKSKLSIGFTLIELVMVIVILSILSIAIVPRFFDSTVFQARGFADQVLATLRYAQKTAIAQHRLVCVNLTATTVTLTMANLSSDASCSLALNLPDRVSNELTAPTGITLTPTITIINFDALGRANTNANITISGVASAIIVEAETGYVHQ